MQPLWPGKSIEVERRATALLVVPDTPLAPLSPLNTNFRVAVLDAEAAGLRQQLEVAQRQLNGELPLHAAGGGAAHSPVPPARNQYFNSQAVADEPSGSLVQYPRETVIGPSLISMADVSGYCNWLVHTRRYEPRISPVVCLRDSSLTHASHWWETVSNLTWQEPHGSSRICV